MSALVWLACLVIGALAGLFSSIMKGSVKELLIMDCVVGVVGSFIGGWIFNALFDVSGFSPWTLFAAFIGAVGLLGLIYLTSRKPQPGEY